MENERYAPYFDTKERVCEGVMVTNLSELQLHGELQCELDGIEFSIKATDRSIVVDVPDVPTGLKLLTLGSHPGAYPGSVQRLKRLLDAAFMILEVRLCGQPIGLLGYNRGTAFWRLFGLPALSLNPVAIAVAYMREKR